MRLSNLLLLIGILGFSSLSFGTASGRELKHETIRKRLVQLVMGESVNKEKNLASLLKTRTNPKDRYEIVNFRFSVINREIQSIDNPAYPTLLHYASIINPQPYVVKILLENLANPNYRVMDETVGDMNLSYFIFLNSDTEVNQTARTVFKGFLQNRPELATMFRPFKANPLSIEIAFGIKLDRNGNTEILGESIPLTVKNEVPQLKKATDLQTLKDFMTDLQAVTNWENYSSFFSP